MLRKLEVTHKRIDIIIKKYAYKELGNLIILCMVKLSYDVKHCVFPGTITDYTFMRFL